MAGIYIHVPFCRKACTYCNFHFSTSLKNIQAYKQALLREIKLQKSFFAPGTIIESVYWGGGTPSVLSITDIEDIWAELTRTFSVSPSAEITLEANPDDLSLPYLRALQNSPVNRLSIGVQSFNDDDLQLMNRSHTAHQSMNCLKIAQEMGFDNITIDLIYGLPLMTEEKWQQQLYQLGQCNIPHFSAYALTVEPKTVLAHQIKSGELAPPDENLALAHFTLMQNFAREQGYLHYEISNLAQPGFKAEHNSSYWQQKPYLGLGPAAHSYQPPRRQWNIANNALYIKYLNNNTIPFEQEILSPFNQYNEYVMTSLRLESGIDENYIQDHFSSNIEEYWQREKARLLNKNQLAQKGNKVYIPVSQRFMSDGIAAELFFLP